MINEKVFTELESSLKRNNCEILNNERSKEYLQFIFDKTTFEIDKRTGLIYPDIVNIELDYRRSKTENWWTIDPGSADIDNTCNDVIIKKWNKIIDLIKEVLKKLNIDIEYPYNLYDCEVICINNKIYKLIMKYDNVCLFYREHGYLGISYHIRYEKTMKENDDIQHLYIPYEDENIVYNFKDAISIFGKRSGLFEVEELNDNNYFSLTEFSTVLYVLSKVEKLTTKQKEDINSFVKKVTRIIKLKGEKV